MSSASLESIFAPSNDVVSREIEGELIIVPITLGIGDSNDELYTLNDTGRVIWYKLDGQRTVRDISMELATNFNAPLDIITRDVLGLVEELARRKIIVSRP